MAAQSKTLSAARGPAIASASRSSTEPRRAGAVRLAVVAGMLAVLASGAAFFGLKWLTEQETLRHLEGLRDAARRDLQSLVTQAGTRVATLADDPRTAAAIANFEDGIRHATVEIAGQKPEDLAVYQENLTRLYQDQLVPAANAAGRPTTLEALYPDDGQIETPNPVVALQALYLDTTGSPVVPGTVAARYGEAHTRHAPWLEAVAAENGWENLHLVDAASSTVLFSATPGVETFTNLSEGAHRGGGLARAVSRAKGEATSGQLFFADAAFGPTDDLARTFIAAPVFSGQRRVGTVVATLDARTIDQALLPGDPAEKWIRAGLGTTGQVVAFAGDGGLRSTSRRSGATPAELSAGLREALAGSSVTATFPTSDGALLGSYAPVDLGGSRWVVAAEQAQAEVDAPLRLLLPLLAGVVVLAALAGWVVGARLWAQYAGKLRTISSVVQKVQRGDRRARLEIHQDGAVGELAASINRLLDDRALVLDRADQDREKLNHDAEQVLEITRQAAAGGPVMPVEIGSSALGNIASALQEMLATIATLSESLRSASSQVATSASQIKSSAEETATNAAQQTRVCNETEGSAKALRADGGRIAEKCTEALEVARRTAQATRMGQTALTDVIAGMEGLQRETRAATVKIKRLGERSMQISAIIGTISKMSAQTDMLALNAAIEASRAGEQGQGFTLVADEVRKLAERASAAAKEIERLIGGIQSDIGDAVGGMERQGERIEVQAAAASQAQHALERVSVVTSEANNTMEDIASTADAQAAAVEKLGEAVAKIAAAATGVQRSSEQTRRGSAELSRLSEELRKRIDSHA